MVRSRGRKPECRAAFGLLAAALVAPPPALGATEWQIRPFAGVTFGGGTTLNDPDLAVGKPNLVLGVSGGLLGDIVGIEADVGHAPGFFQTGDGTLVSSSRVTTFTGNVIVGLPRRATEYSLRPYFVGGLGVMRAHAVDSLGDAVPVDMTRPAFDLGGGLGGALSNRTGLSWELRYFRSFRGKVDPLGVGLERLSFWRANMAVVIRL
ncbi:MAG: hypothetical protein A3H97_22540 [Acidobacteria bacterium RIFCSPLOWO2_02_FULL_65_29]|nr:MAG: hypothetical protein A3H97_22540 [Acidobacteria bacterium RIFCSPLOWO2_02_FULL_65_29]